ncbi:3-hydroxydecanoyl-[ACP] dehydratase [hydrothermal vent metagenome]|uniref:3-hydroxydecanoyl-[ACP] dehydratase n=1 Tax=hydrothermal vent metagenome TaxID=652676 RepID=A0A3B0Y405_9ZZZZ
MLKHNEICELIPHAGEMCLLDSVKNWDEEHIVCTANTHRSMSNPLRNDKGLPMLSLVEYAAQAIAVHGCLSAANNLFIKKGVLAALRDVQVAPGWLSDIEAEIEISARRVYVEAGSMIYTISASAASNGDTLDKQVKKMLASGRATVMAEFSN